MLPMVFDGKRGCATVDILHHEELAAELRTRDRYEHLDFHCIGHDGIGDCTADSQLTYGQSGHGKAG